MRSKNIALNLFIVLIITISVIFVIQGSMFINLKNFNDDFKPKSLIQPVLKANALDNDYALIWNSSILIGDVKVVDIANDIDKDGTNEILASNGYKVTVFEYNKTQQTFLEDGSTSTDTVWRMCFGNDLDEDGKKEIISASSNGDLYVSEYNETSYTYNIVFQKFIDMFLEGLCIGEDLDKDGKKEIIVGSYGGLLAVFEYNNTDNGYSNVWQTTLADGIIHLGFGNDLDKDGKAEILISTYAGELIIFENNGADSYINVWNSGSILSELYSTSTGNDLDGDGKMEIVTSSGSSQRVDVFEFDGTDNSYTKVWDSGLTLSVNIISVCIGDDLDQDGKFEIMAGASNGTIYAFEFNGTDNSYSKVWDSRTMLGSSILSLCVGKDLNGNGYKEFIAGSSADKIHIFESSSALIPKDTPSNGFQIPGYNIFTFALIIGITSVILIKKKFNSK